MKIVRAGSIPSGAGPASEFTGAVRRDPLVAPDAPGRTVAGVNTFEPGARTAWHTHPVGQMLFVTAGVGWAQVWGEPVEEIRPGDSVYFAAGVKHWHGATRTTGMSHLAVTEMLDGKAVEWLEHVTDEQYNTK